MSIRGRWVALCKWPVGFAAALLLVFSAPVHAAEIVLERTAVQKLVKRALFTGQNERMYLAADPCYAYLEYPEVRLTGNRVHISGHFSGRFGSALGGTCLGAGLASNFTVSGKPAFRGGMLILEDLRLDSVQDRLTDIFRSALFPRLPQALQVDLRAAVQDMLHDSTGQIQAVVDSFAIQAVTAENDQLTVQLDFKLRGR